MGNTTRIEWTDSTWNPIRGCSRVSEGCRNCYAEAIAARFSKTGQAYEGLATLKGLDARWTGEVRLIETHLEDPIRWRKPRKIFVNSMSDLFHPGVKDEWLTEIFSVMARAPRHIYQILTKRPERMLEALTAGAESVAAALFTNTFGQPWPPLNWWFGVSVEDHETATHRLPILAKCPAFVRFVSYEPALGPVHWESALTLQEQRSAISWIIAGGESGTNARRMHPDWARSARQFCNDNHIAFFFKQWGEFHPNEIAKVGKKKAGSVLDGVEWRDFPPC
jgi:protein gp37